MKRIVFSCLCILCLSTSAINAGIPHVINLNVAIIYNPLGGPDIETGSTPICQSCFTATLTDNVLNVSNSELLVI